MQTLGISVEKRGTPARPVRGGRDRLWVAFGVLFSLQALWLVGFSVAEFHADALTLDYSIFYQAAWQIAHGHLDPFSSSQGFSFWRNHGEALLWVLAPLTRLPPHGLWLLIAQDLATAGAEWVALGLVRDLTGQPSWPERLPRRLATATAALLLLANPWIYDASAFDFHMQAFAVLACLLAARSLLRGQHRRVALFVVVALACGDVAGTYVFGLGLTGVVLARLSGRSIRPGLVLVLAGVAWTLVISALHANQGSGLNSAYGYLAGSGHPGLAGIITGAIGHPGRAAGQLQLTFPELYDTVLPVGIIGLFTPWSAVPWMTLLADGLHSGTSVARPDLHQPLPVWPFTVIGTVWALGWLARRSRTGLVAVPIVVVTSMASALVWLPRYPGDWLSVPPSAAAVLRHWAGVIPASDEVVVSNGVAGRFADRPYIYVALFPEAPVPLFGRPVYFVLAVTAGIEPAAAETAALAEAARLGPGARVVDARAGVEVIYWSPPPGQRQLTSVP